MAEIKCPNCGTVISLEQSDLDSVVRQVRDEEFARDLAERTATLEADKAQAVKLAKAEARSAAKDKLGEKDAQIAELTAQLAAMEARLKAEAQTELARQKAEGDAALAQAMAKAETELANARAEGAAAVAQARAQAESELERVRTQADAKLEGLETKLKGQADAFAAEKELAVSQARSQAEAEIGELKSALALGKAEAEALREKSQAQAESIDSEKKLAVAQAVAAVEKERDQLKLAVDAKELEKAAIEAQMREKMAEQVEARDAIIRLREEELDRLKDMRSRLSTKMVGESLEQHCHDEFNRIRAAAFPRAYFEKDTETVGGTKGDFIFREAAEDGTEFISIMFEMKNEGDTDSRKTHNEDHLAKLDKDRTKKNCEYAVLVSLLEPESELYNEGIVDMSHRYPKMYVIRPQFFIPIISLLRNAALNSLEYKQEAALMRQQNLDISTFEAEIEAFKTGFFRNYENASRRFEDAIGDIDRTIKLLEKIKDNLTKSEKHLTAANNKLDDLTVKKLTRKNPTVRALFEELHAEAEAEIEEE